MSAAPVAGAEPTSPIELVWAVPPECPGREEVLRHLGELVEGNVEAEAHVTAYGMVARAGTGPYRLTLETRVGEVRSVRTIDAVTCGSLAKAAAVVISVALSPAPAQAPEPIPSVPTPVPSPRATRPASPGAVATRSSVSWSAGVAGAIETAALADVMAGVALMTSLDIKWLRLGAIGVVYGPRHVSFTTPVTATVRFDVWTIGIRGCSSFELGHALRGGPCVELGASFTHVKGVQLMNARAEEIVLPTAAGGAILELELTHRVHAFFSPDVTVPLRGVSVGVRTSGGDLKLDDLSKPAFRALLGLHFRLW